LSFCSPLYLDEKNPEGNTEKIQRETPEEKEYKFTLKFRAEASKLVSRYALC